MDVYWLEQSVADVPARDDWLSPGEAERLRSMRFEKRRSDWLLGRWTAKCALAAHLNMSLAHNALAAIELCPAPSGAPEPLIEGRPADATISLSHRGGVAMCALAATGVMLGCDLELAEPRSQEFVADYFTEEEQRLALRAHGLERDVLTALLWSAKESALKAMRLGLMVDTRALTVHPGAPSECEWQPVTVSSAYDQNFQGWWRYSGGAVRTVLAAPAPSRPVRIKVTEFAVSGAQTQRLN